MHHYLKSIFHFYRITGDPQKVEYAKQLVYELIAEKEMQMFHRGGRNTTERAGSYSNDTGFNHGPANNDGVEINNDQVYISIFYFYSLCTIKIRILHVVYDSSKSN